MLQRSLLAYQSTEFNADGQKSDYVDQSMISHSVLKLPSSSLSMISKSVDRVSGVDDISSASAQSNLQRKLRLKTNKQYKFITDRASQGIKPRPASSLATNPTAFHTVNNRQGSEGRQTHGSGAMNLSTATGKPTTQFKILQFNSGSSVSRDQSNGSTN
jgi:hypothetical protein